MLPENKNEEKKDEKLANQIPLKEKTNEEGAIPASFDEWLEKADEPTKKLIGERFTALESTVKATRSERDELKGELQKMMKKLGDKDVEAQSHIQEMIGKMEIAERKANFMEDALRPEIGCRNPRTAYALAVAEDLFTKNGSPDWASIKTAAPELFGIGKAQGKAGAGTGEEPKNQDMNTIIRRIAGVGQ